MYQARYAIYIVAKYLYTATFKASKKFYNINLPSDTIFTKAGASNSDYQAKKLTREFNTHYRACIGSLIYLLSNRVYLGFSVHNFETFSSNPGKVHSGGLVHLLR